jgi:hypothetical protein
VRELAISRLKARVRIRIGASSNTPLMSSYSFAETASINVGVISKNNWPRLSRQRLATSGAAARSTPGRRSATTEIHPR